MLLQSLLLQAKSKGSSSFATHQIADLRMKGCPIFQNGGCSRSFAIDIIVLANKTIQYPHMMLISQTTALIPPGQPAITSPEFASTINTPALAGQISVQTHQQTNRRRVKTNNLTKHGTHILSPTNDTKNLKLPPGTSRSPTPRRRTLILNTQTANAISSTCQQFDLILGIPDCGIFLQ